jgi:hypothetical protein
MSEVKYLRHKDADYVYIATPELLARGDMLPAEAPAPAPAPAKAPAKPAKPAAAKTE